MAGFQKNKGEPISAINVTPFVDIVLVLLVVLMVTSVHIVKASLEVDLPTAASGGAKVDSTLNLVIEADGDWLLDGEETSEEELIAYVERETRKNPELRAVIDGDRSVPYDRVIHAIDVIKSHGIKSFALNIQRSTNR